MWNLINIKAHGICTLKELDYSIEQGVTTLLFGENLDNESQLSNGSGKSSLLEAISIGITGDTLRKVQIDDIINDACDSADITITLQNDALNLVMEISRLFKRGKSQVITCLTHVIGSEEITEISQPSVSEYNKYIIDAIGLTKDDIFSNFILSKHKYVSFLSSSDKDKKELINRFSNGNMVDEAIEILDADIAAEESVKGDVEMNVSRITGSIASLEEQIEKAKQRAIDNKQSKEIRKQDLIGLIEKKREEARECRNFIASLESKYQETEEKDKLLADVEDSDKSAVECYEYIRKTILIDVRDPSETIRKYKERIRSAKAELSEYTTKQNDYKVELDKLSNDVDLAKEELEKSKSSLDEAVDRKNEKVKECNRKIAELTYSIKDNEEKAKALNDRMRNLNNLLAGTITCPKCKHEFILSSDISVDDARNEIVEINKNIKKYESTITKDNDRVTEYNKQIDDSLAMVTKYRSSYSNNNDIVCEIAKKLSVVSEKISKITEIINNLNKDIQNYENDIASVREELFDQAFDAIDSIYNAIKADKEKLNTKIHIIEGDIEACQKSISDIDNLKGDDIIESLKKSKKEYEKQFEVEDKKLYVHTNSLAKLKEQSSRFIEFKTHLANTKISALSQLTNEFLQNIGSDIRIIFSGFTILKSGKVRDKISISILRDGIDCGSFNKLSEGEKCRVELANILAMHKLTNVNCIDNKGLNLLIIDEILDSSDETGLSSVFNALNQLKITALVVSHGNIAENYQYRLIVRKSNGISTLHDRK